MITEDQYKRAIILISEYKRQLADEYNERNKAIEKALKGQQLDPNTKVVDTDASIRLLNVLRFATPQDVSMDEITLGYIALNYTCSSLREVSNCGWKTLQEVTELLSSAGLIIRDK